MMQIVEMSTSVEFKMWSMSPLIVVPLINQSQLISTEESEFVMSMADFLKV